VKEKIPEITIKLGDTTYETNHQEELKVARETIDQDMIEQAPLYAWYAVLAEMLDEMVGNRKLDLSVLEGQLYNEYKKKALEVSAKVTDKAVDSEVKQDERFIAATLDVLTAKKNKGIFTAITKAFEHRKEMLINLGAKFRKEMDGDVIFKRKEKE